MATQETVTVTQFSFDPNHIFNIIAGLSAGLVAFGVVIFIALFIIRIFFCYSCYKTMLKVPCQYRLAPAWLNWLMLIPLIGYIFEWIMLPFMIPNSIKQYKADDVNVTSKAKSLFGIGLAFVLVSIACMIPIVNILGFIAMFILWIVYWVKVAGIRELL